MKKHLLSICCMILTMGLVMTSCEKTPDDGTVKTTEAALELSSTDSKVSINTEKTSATALIDHNGGEIKVTVTSTLEDWQHVVTDENKRFTVTKSDNILTISAPENTSPEATYSMAVNITTGTEDNQATAVITVTQSSASPAIYYTIEGEGISCDEENNILSIELGSGEAEIDGIVISSNFGGWEFNTDANDLDWLTLEKDNDRLIVKAAQNPDFEDRNGSFTLTIGEGEFEKTITVNVSQAKLTAAVSIALSASNTGNIEVAPDGKSASNLELPIAGDTFIFDITCDNEWNYTLSNESEEVNTVSINGSELTYTVMPNSSSDTQKELTLTIYSGVEGNSSSATITIKQRCFMDENPNMKAMIFEITTASANQLVRLPLFGEINCYINWGDGSPEEVYTKNVKGQTDAASHTYATSGKYDVKIIGNVPALNCGSTIIADNTYLTAVKDWGNTGLTSMNKAFQKCKGLKSLPNTDEHNALGAVTDFLAAFRESGLTSVPADLLKTAVNSELTSFKELFHGCTELTSIPATLFAANTQITDFQNVFYGCAKLESIPATLFENNSAAETFQAAFNGCVGLQAIPATLFEKNTAVTTFANAFNNCTKLNSIPEGLFAKNTLVTHFNNLFSACSLLETIPANLFATNTAAESFAYVFYNCAKISSIPANLFEKNTAVNTFANAFQNCAELTSIPVGLFATNSQVTTFYNTFYGCAKLTSIPENIFENNTEVESFGSTFYGCAELETIPANLFEKNTKVTTFANTFSGCKKLATIPANLFEKNTAVTTFASTFFGCAELESIPATIFANKPVAVTFTSVFNGCAKIESLPATLFASVGEVTGGFGNAFQNCTKLKNIPKELFESNTKATSFVNVFKSCASLEVIPVGLLANNENVTTVNSMFMECTELTTVPTSIFDNCKKITNFGNLFNGCTKLTGESPYYTGSDPKIHIYERKTGDGYTTTPPAAAASNKTGCFTGCTLLTDYLSIPSTWGGGGN